MQEPRDFVKLKEAVLKALKRLNPAIRKIRIVQKEGSFDFTGNGFRGRNRQRNCDSSKGSVVKISISPKLHRLAGSVKKLGKKAVLEYTPLVETLIQQESRNKRQIEQLLDGMLGFCFERQMLLLFKKLCRYYFTIDPRATTYYIHAYCEMWDQ